MGYKKTLFSFALSLMLLGCGGGGSGSSEDTISKVEINATVIDGYLNGAKVWLDVNENFEFDEGEPFAVSGELGKVTLDVTSIDNPNSYPIVAQAEKDQTIDESTGNFVTQNFVMSAPQGEMSITPLSTLVHLQLEQNTNGAETPDEFSSKLTEAKDAVASSLGINSNDVLGDYVEENNGDALYAAENIVASGVLPEEASELESISNESTGNSQFDDDVSSVNGSIKLVIDSVNLNDDMSFDEQTPVYNPVGQDNECETGFVQDGVICVIDLDNDAIGNNVDTDDDGDGVADSSDAFPLDATESLDTDSDSLGNNTDSDDDNDGVADSNDAFPLDATESLDTDGDNVGNNADTDDDNDGVADTADAFPLDSSESVDTDGDNVGNNADTDDDNDGVADTTDAFPLDSSESVDTDGDNIGNNADTDDDNDGVSDLNDENPLNPNPIEDSISENICEDNNGYWYNSDCNINIEPKISITQPPVIGSGCEFTTAVNDDNNVDITSVSWSITSDTNELIVEGDLTGSQNITTTIPTSGHYLLSAIATFQNGAIAESSENLLVEKSLPVDIQFTEYTIGSGESYVLCQDVNVLNNATFTIEKGASLASIDDTAKTIYMVGDVTISGEEDDRVSIDNVVFAHAIDSTDPLVVNAQYVDFTTNATIDSDYGFNNDHGTTNISYSSFDSKFNLQGRGNFIYNAFYKGLMLQSNGGIISHNDIHCEGLSSCISVNKYMYSDIHPEFGEVYEHTKPTIANNNIFGAAANSITYENNYLTDADIDMRNNYWGGKSSTELNEVFVDANDTSYKSFMFLFDPKLEDEVEHSNEEPIANAGIDKNTVLNYAISIDGTMSSDINGDELSYQWTLINKPTGSLAILDSNTDSVSSLIPDVLGDYTIELTVFDGVLESKDTVTISALEDYTITYAPVTNGLKVSTCMGVNSTSLGGYFWTFSDCNVYGNAGNPVGIKITNNHPEDSIRITKLGIYISGFYMQSGNIASGSQVVEPNSTRYFQLNMDTGGLLSRAFFQLDGVSGYSYGVLNDQTFSE